ncbi:MAG: hypothetical protein EHM12_05120, partial [Dehalococcoidia bacterium]
MENTNKNEDSVIKKIIKKKKKKVIKGGLIGLIVVLALIIMLAGGAFAYLNNVNNAALPKLSGQLKERGAWAKVEIIRDEYGVPHIYGQNMHDLYFAQGYVQAQDRWWQMEFFRHVCGGRIEELTGKKAHLVSTDIYLRTMGWYRIAEKEYNSYTLTQRAVLDAFSEGVNAYISNRSPEQLSVNYAVLGLTGVKFNIEPWKPVDTLAFSKLFSYDMGYAADEELQRSKLHDLLGAEMNDAWQTPPFGYGEKPTVLQGDDVKSMEAAGWTKPPAITDNSSSASIFNTRSYDDTKPDLTWLSGDPSGIGSNNWVASSNMTQGGKPLLANDPHLFIQMPSAWYEISLHSTDNGNGQSFDVAGFAIASSPGVIIGHNND